MKMHLFDFIFGLIVGSVMVAVAFFVVQPGFVSLLPWIILDAIAFFAYMNTPWFRKRIKNVPSRSRAILLAILLYSAGLVLSGAGAVWYLAGNLWGGSLL